MSGSFTTRNGDEICLFIQKFWKEIGTGPTIRDIAEAFGMKSTSTAFVTIRNLERQGRVMRSGRRKVIKVVDGLSPALCVHDWRVKDPIPDNGEVMVFCVICGFRSAKEFSPNPDDPKTWLRFVG